MRVHLFCILLALLLPVAACKRQQAQVHASNAFTFHSSAFSSLPGEAWSGDSNDMLKDMEKVIKSGKYEKLSPTVGVPGFAGHLNQAVILRPLKIPGKQGETVYALESTACGQSINATPYESIREIFNKKYTPYTVLPQQ